MSSHRAQLMACKFKFRITHMTEDYNPTDNAVAERVNGIIKQEWLYRMKRPASVGEAERTISRIIRFYNDVRPHMNNIGRMPPGRLRRLLAGT